MKATGDCFNSNLLKMYKNTLLIFCFTISFSIVSGVERYAEVITDSVEVQTHIYTTIKGEELGLDIYLPAFDAEEKRATIIYVHGGGFSGGTREAGTDFCTTMSKLGYVAVSMSYRLTRKGTPEGFGCDCPVIDKLSTFSASVSDIQDATFFLIQHREEFGIDPQKIILSGSSAGAEAILNAGYMPPMCYDLPSGPVSYAGLISMAGAIPDTTVIYDESAIPSMFFHGTCDNLVPYATAPHHYCNKNKKGYLILHGSYTLAQKLHELSIPYWLHTTCGGGHEMAGKPMTKYIEDIKTFCYQYVVKGEGEYKTIIIKGDQTKCNYEQFDFCKE